RDDLALDHASRCWGNARAGRPSASVVVLVGLRSSRGDSVLEPQWRRRTATTTSFRLRCGLSAAGIKSPGPVVFLLRFLEAAPLLQRGHRKRREDRGDAVVHGYLEIGVGDAVEMFERCDTGRGRVVGAPFG